MQPGEGWGKYWVLLIDLMGFSRAVMNPDGRNALTAAYENVVKAVGDDCVQFKLMELAGKKALQDLAVAMLMPASVEEAEQRKERLRKTAEDSGKMLADVAGFDALRINWRSRIRVFSDSLFFFFDADADGRVTPSGKMFAAPVASFVSAILWAKGLAHRGSLSLGDCYLKPDGSVFLGPPIVRAHDWERQQQWLGISVEPASYSRHADLDVLPGFVRPAQVPVAGGSVPTSVVTYGGELLNELKKLLGAVNIPTTAEVLDGFARAYAQAEQAGLVAVIPKYVNTARLLRDSGMTNDTVERLAAP
jgi:hypothetical protein